MAEAQKRVQVTSVDLYLSIEEARVLSQVLMHVGGRQDNKYYANLRGIELALERAGVEPHPIGSTGSIYIS